MQHAKKITDVEFCLNCGALLINQPPGHCDSCEPYASIVQACDTEIKSHNDQMLLAQERREGAKKKLSDLTKARSIALTKAISNN
jgi:hypothetical protein